MPDIWMDVDASLAEVPVNLMPLIDDTDFRTVEDAIAHNAAGMDLRWNFVTSAGAYTSTAVTPTTAGDYDWTHQGDGMYSIEIPASGGASINNDTEGYGWFTGMITGVLPFRGPVIGFRASGLNDLLCDSAYSATRGLSGTALPDAAADAAGGLPISDAGGLDLDAKLAATNEVTAARMGALTDWIDGGRLDLIVDAILIDTAEIGAEGAGLTEAGGTGDQFTAVTGRLPATLVNGRMDSTVSAINDDTAAAARLALSAAQIIPGTVDSTAFAPTTTEFEADDITEATAQHYNGRVIIFTSGVLIGQATSISNYSLATGRGHFTVVAMTEAPGNNDTFIIV